MLEYFYIRAQRLKMVVASILAILLAANQVSAASIADSTADADEISRAHFFTDEERLQDLIPLTPWFEPEVDFTEEEWLEIFENQKLKPEVYPEYVPITNPPHEIRKRSPETSVPAQQAEHVYKRGIYSGTKAVKCQIPWQASLEIDGLHFCGASLISHTTILTAAHCVDGFKTYEITLGSTSRIQEQENSVKQISRTGIVHKDYHFGTVNKVWELKNDVAIIKIKEVEESAYIKIIQLPKSSQAMTTFEGEEARASGFGQVAGGQVSNDLIYADVKVVSNEECAKNFGKTLKHTNICTVGTGARKPCRGDSGGALTLKDNGTVIHTGIVSFVRGGCPGKIPSGYARTTSFLKWISVNGGIPLRE